VDPVRVRLRGRTLLYFGGCDYFRLSFSSEVRAAARRGIERHGLGVAASRQTSGNRGIYEELESELALFFGAETALLVSNGYSTSLVVAQALAGACTHALIDEYAHGALQDAARTLDCPTEVFRHRSVKDVARRVGKLGGGARPILLTDGLFAHSGAVAPLAAYARVLPVDAVTLVDDAHGAGVVGDRGQGSAELEKVRGGRLIRAITLSKAFGAYGGVVLGSGELRATIVGRSRLAAGTTPVPPHLAEAALCALRLLRRRPGLRVRLHGNARYLREKLRAGGVTVPDRPGPMVAVVARDGEAKEGIDRCLLRAAILPPYVDYVGRPGPGYYRCAVSSAHRREDLDRLSSALLQCRELWAAA
jgi:8-amino-7-oxononanoate synthase